MSAIAAGAEIVEKHIALENQIKGHDIKFSLKGKEIKKFKEDIFFVINLFNKEKFSRNKSEDKSKILEDQFLLLKIFQKVINLLQIMLE